MEELAPRLFSRSLWPLAIRLATSRFCTKGLMTGPEYVRPAEPLIIFLVFDLDSIDERLLDYLGATMNFVRSRQVPAQYTSGLLLGDITPVAAEGDERTGSTASGEVGIGDVGTRCGSSQLIDTHKRNGPVSCEAGDQRPRRWELEHAVGAGAGRRDGPRQKMAVGLSKDDKPRPGSNFGRQRLPLGVNGGTISVGPGGRFCCSTDGSAREWRVLLRNGRAVMNTRLPWQMQ